MNRFKISKFGGLLILLSALCACAGSARGQNLAIRAYRVGNGLAHDHVTKIQQDARGYIWLATYEGLSRFDGYSFANYGVREGLTNALINDVAFDRQGRLWVATNGGGVARFLDDPAERAALRLPDERARTGAERFVNYAIAESVEANRVNRLLFDAENRLWCVTDEGLYRARAPEVTASDFEQVAASDGPYFTNGVLADSHGRLWFSLNSNLVQVASGVVTHYAPWRESDSVASASALNDINSIIEDDNGRILAADSTALYEFIEPPLGGERGSWRRLRLALAPGQHINVIMLARDGRLLAGTTHGLVSYRADAQSLYTTAHGLSANEITALGEDRDGNLWIGTKSGLNKLADERIINYTATNGLPSSHINRLIEGRDGNIYANVASAPPSVARISDEGLSLIPRAQLGEAACCLEHLKQDPRGRWWTRTARGLEIFPGPELSLRHGYLCGPADGLPVSNQFELNADATGRIFVVTYANGDVYTADATSETPPRFQFLAGAMGVGTVALAGPSGAPLWLGKRGGSIWRWTNGRLEELRATDGLPATDPRVLFLDSGGRMWVGLRYHGLSMTEEPAAERPRFTNYSVRTGLSSDTVWAITEDQDGLIYLGTGRGLDQLDPATGRIRHFTAEDGVVGSSVTHLLTDRRGRVWVATNGGISVIDPRAPRVVSPPPQIFINHLRVAGEDLPLPEHGAKEVAPLTLSSARNNISIGFVAPSFRGERSLRYQYWLEGVDAVWSAPTEQREVNYARLAPGSYRFLVRAVNGDGAASEPAASFSFTIRPPMWQRWWFLALAALAVGVVSYTVYRYRVARLLEVERVRMRIATDLHDDIGANLTKIAILSEVARRQLGETSDGKASPLSAIATISRESVAAMSDIVWAINPKRDSLRDLTRRMRQHADEIFMARGIQLDFRAPAGEQEMRLGVDVRRDLFLIFKEAVNNAARHAGCRKVEINLQADGSEIRLRVADDGVGFDPAAATDGNGLVSMQRRAERLGGKLKIESGAGQGTSLLLTVPRSAPRR